jgi:2-C-methyl-D-erythritol 2,4-cyclodiphosphate synthase
MLGGVHIPSPKGEDAHSDGDVLIHAVIDALLGAAALGDIGTHFPNDDPQWKDADSRSLLEHVMNLIVQEGYRIGNLDTTIVLQSPRLSSHISSIRSTLAELLGVELSAVSIKAKSAEHIGDVGEIRAVEAYACVTLFSADGVPPEAWV